MWRDGKRLVARRGAMLPRRCVRCNVPTNEAPFQRKLSYIHPAIFLLLPLWVLFIIVAFALQKKAELTISLCNRHLVRRRRAKTTLLVSLIGAPALLVLAGLADNGALAWIALIVFVAGISLATWGMGLIGATKIDPHFVRVIGVDKAFLATLPSWREPAR